MSDENTTDLQRLIALSAAESRIKALQMTSKAKSSHIGSCLSVIDILTVLFAMKKLSNEHFQDQVILSKGHAAAALYAVLNTFGFLESNLEDFCTDNSKIYGHTNHLASNLIPLSTGSLGHGLPFGVGLAFATKLKRLNQKIFVVISDGELNEGTTWESALIAGHHKLSNLVVFIDRNQIQSMGFTESILKLDPIGNKWETFGWDVIEVDGHNFKELIDAVMFKSSKPLCVVANTVKGKGVDFMEGTLKWHYRSPDKDELINAIMQIKRDLL